MESRIPQSVVKRVPFKAFLSSDHVTPATGKTIPVQVSKNGAGFANLDTPSNATEIGAGWYYINLATADIDTLGPLIVRGTEGTIDPAEVVYDVVDPFNAGFTALPAIVAGAASGIPLKDASNFLDVANMPAVAAGGAGGLFIAGTNAATVVTTSFTTTFTGNLSGTIGGLAAQAKTDVNNEMLDVLFTDTYAEPSDEAVPSTLSIGDGIRWLFKGWRNKKHQDSDDFDLYNAAGDNIDQNATISDVGTDFIKDTMTGTG